ncbi:MAG TPA: hypothetical protein VN873_11115 [Candidatus Angelobacter sp.]|nr:hypothetical protein [Candidatus Angelobacter sp.]
MRKRSQSRPGYALIFRPWIIHPVTKQVIYPKRGKVFPIWVKTDGEQLNLGLN